MKIKCALLIKHFRNFESDKEVSDQYKQCIACTEIDYIPYIYVRNYPLNHSHGIIFSDLKTAMNKRFNTKITFELDVKHCKKTSEKFNKYTDKKI